MNTKKFNIFLEKKDNLLSHSPSQQHSKKKLSARERIELLLDKNSFVEHGLFVKHNSKDFDMDKKDIPFDGVITGYGTIFNRSVFVFSQDFTAAGGSLGQMHAKKILNIQKLALKAKVPLIGIQDSGGARIQEGVDSLAGYGEIFQNNINSSGTIPQISLIMGPCAGGAVYSPALTDFTIMVNDTSFMFITGPDVIKEVNKENVTYEELGGSQVHTEITGACDNTYFNDLDAIIATKKLFSFIPQSCYELTKNIKYSEFNKDLSFLNSFISENSLEPYDMNHIITSILDNEDFHEIKKEFAKNIIIGFGRIEGETIGIVANQPLESAGCLDINAARKAARFIRFCDCFNIPIISFVDTPGFLPGLEQEHGNIIQHGAKLLYSYGEATVPKITIITRKAYGGAYIVMGSKHLNSDVNYAWPTAEIAVLGSKPAAKILFKNIKEDMIQENIKKYEEKFLSPYLAAEKGYIDAIIKPEETRSFIIKNLKILSNKKKLIKKHDNLPL